MARTSAVNASGEQVNAPQRQPPSLTLLVLAALGPVLLIFAAYEIVERVWLQGVDMERIHMLHWIRGLLAAVIAALLASWLILRRSPARRPSLDALAAPPAIAPTPIDRVEHYSQWFILMRWIAIVVAAVLVFVAIGMVDVLPRESWRPLMLTIAVLAAMNAAYSALLKAGQAALRVLLPLQAYGDLLILVVLLHFSGGIENPLAMLMLFHVIIAGIVLTRRHCFLVAAAGSTLFALLVLAEWGHWIDHYTLRVFPHFADGVPLSHAAHNGSYALTGVGIQTAILFLTAYFTTTVTERLRDHERQLEVFANRMLAQSQMLERALDITDTGLCVCDHDFSSSWSNRRWESWFEGPPGGICAGVTALDGSIPARDTLMDGRVRVADVTLRRTGDPQRGGTEGQRIIQLTTAPLVDQEGTVTHVVQLASEITRQKQVQAGMVRAEKLAAVGELAGKIAHEVNNPIAIISAKARLLLADQGEPLSPRITSELTKITELADRVARIAQGLLSYCRPASGGAAPVDVRVPVRKALSIMEPAAAAATVSIQSDLVGTLPEVRVNSAEMEQVFLNLFMNALDAMPDGGRLTVSARLDDIAAGDVEPAVLVIVEDTGHGIPEDIRDRVFEPFVTTKDEGQGTGLGLSICLGLVRSNGGEISLESESGVGTRVRIRIPAQVAATRVNGRG